MTTIAELQTEIELAVQHDEVDFSRRPSISHVIALGRAWKVIGGTYFETRVARRGWKTDFVRAAKHFFAAFACANVSPGLTISDSRELPERIHEMITRYLRGEQIATYEPTDDAERIDAQEARFLDVANALDLYYDTVCDLAEALCLARAHKSHCARESLRTRRRMS